MGLIQLSNLDGANGFTINAVVANGLGGRASGIGDFNADGFDDVIISAPSANSPKGEAYVVYGRSTFPGEFELSTLDGMNGFKIPGIATSGSLGLA